jgi:hypothetical protein
VLSEAELRELAAKLPDSGLTTTAQAAFWIMLSTLCPIGELSKARWGDDVDLVSGLAHRELMICDARAPR